MLAKADIIILGLQRLGTSDGSKDAWAVCRFQAECSGDVWSGYLVLWVFKRCRYRPR
jgi:hypothetical protein